jgi:hypothetical protein
MLRVDENHFLFHENNLLFTHTSPKIIIYKISKINIFDTL